MKTVEVFTAGCAICEPAVALVKEMACSDCNVIVYDLREGCETNACREKAKTYGISRLPAVVVDGRLLACCEGAPVDSKALHAAGVGVPSV